MRFESRDIFFSPLNDSDSSSALRFCRVDSLGRPPIRAYATVKFLNSESTPLVVQIQSWVSPIQTMFMLYSIIVCFFLINVFHSFPILIGILLIGILLALFYIYLQIRNQDKLLDTIWQTLGIDQSNLPS